MLNPNSRLSLGSTFQNKLPLASAKATYTNVFYHGANLEDVTGAIVDFDSENDHFAERNFLIRLPRVARFIMNAPGLTVFEYYRDIALALATEHPSICVTLGAYFPQLSFRWLLNVTPSMGAQAAADIYAGEVLTFFLSFRSLNYSFHDSANAPNAQYTSDYTSFTERHPRHVRFRGYFWNLFHTSGGFDDQQVIDNAMAGTGAFAALGPGLSEYGWSAEHETWNLPASYIPASTFRQRFTSFFGL